MTFAAGNSIQSTAKHCSEIFSGQTVKVSSGELQGMVRLDLIVFCKELRCGWKTFYYQCPLLAWAARAEPPFPPSLWTEARWPFDAHAVQHLCNRNWLFLYLKLKCSFLCSVLPGCSACQRQSCTSIWPVIYPTGTRGGRRVRPPPSITTAIKPRVCSHRRVAA